MCRGATEYSYTHQPAPTMPTQLINQLSNTTPPPLAIAAAVSLLASHCTGVHGSLAFPKPLQWAILCSSATGWYCVYRPTEASHVHASHSSSSRMQTQISLATSRKLPTQDEFILLLAFTAIGQCSCGAVAATGTPRTLNQSLRQ